MMKLPRYTDEEIKRIEKEFEKIEWRPADEFPEFKDVEVVSVYVGNKIPVKAHYRKINGRRVYVKAHYRRKPKHARKTKP